MHGLAWFIGFALITGIFVNLTPCLLSYDFQRVNTITYKLKNRFYQRFIAAFLLLIGHIIVFSIITIPIVILSHSHPAFFQSTLFLIPLSSLLLITGLLTFFKIKFPTPKKTEEFKSQSFIGAFITGVLLTLLAFPNCGWFLLALFASATVLSYKSIIVFFASLSIGLALPLFIFLLIPKLTRHIDQIEKCSIQAIKVLALVLLVGSLFFSQAFIPIAYFFWVKMLLEVSIVIWALFHLVRNKIIINRVIPIFVLALYVLFNFTLPQPASLTLNVQYSPEIIQYARSKYRPVLLIFTADWCISCKLQEKYVYKDPYVFQIAKKKNLIPLVVDMTQPTIENKKLFKKYRGKTLPHAVLLDDSGNIQKLLPEIISTKSLISQINNI